MLLGWYIAYVILLRCDKRCVLIFAALLRSPLLPPVGGCRILRHLASKEQRVTLKQLVEAWRAKKGAKAMPDHVTGDSRRPVGLSRSTCERLVLRLLGLGVLSDDFHFTAFSVVHYIVTGARAHALESGRLKMALEVPAAEAEGAGAVAAAASPRGAAAAAAGGGKSKGDPPDRGGGGAGGGGGGAKGKGKGARGGKNGASGSNGAVVVGVLEDGADGVNGRCAGQPGGDGGRGGNSRGGKKRPRATAAAAASSRRSSSSSAVISAAAGAGWGTSAGTEGVGVVDLCDDSSCDGGDRDDGVLFQGDDELPGKEPLRNVRRNRTGVGGEGSPVVTGGAGGRAGGGGIVGEGAVSSSSVCDADVVDFCDSNDDDSDFEKPFVKKKANKKKKKKS